MYLEKPEISTINQISIEEVLNDYYIACLSRQLSILGRREVHNGRAHFGIFGDGKEIPQLAMAKFFQKGDWRSGYYRDQTFMLALGLLQPEEFFAMIYGETDDKLNPSTGGRNFNNHFTTSNLDENGEIKNLAEKYNSAADISSTGGQMPRLLGLAQASKVVREHPELKKHLNNNVTGNEVAFGTIGDASTSEGLFFETINAAGVMQVPMAVVVYDDGYGISVPTELQTTKANISAALKGFQKDSNTNGIDILTCKGWDYPALVKTFSDGITRCRRTQTPVLFHVRELTQPQGHSTSGSHERYKSKERLEWEKKTDGISQFKKWLLETGKADIETLTQIESKASKRAKEAKKNAWKNFTDGFVQEIEQLNSVIKKIKQSSNDKIDGTGELDEIKQRTFPTRRKYLSFAKRLFLEIHTSSLPEKAELGNWISNFEKSSRDSYNKQLYREGVDSALEVKPNAVKYSAESIEMNGSEILSRNFDALFNKYPNLVTFGQDTGKLGDVNQGMKGMQAKYGQHRVSDAGIREATIIGQGIGMALRGFRPIAEIQYLDYLIYAHSTLSDDLASLQYRTKGKQVAPLIVRTRGHQLQGMWHAGSPMQMLLGSLRGMYLCVPRNLTQAAGMYNTLLEANEPALVIEPLKGYNVKELLPENIGEFKVPLGVPEIIREGTDITFVTYAWNVHHASKAAELLEHYNISAEVIDVQTLLPFDKDHVILKSIQKTNKVLFIDEDVPGGATAYMMQKVLEDQKAFDYLDTSPRTLPAMEHKPAYGIDGEYFSKPNVELIFETVWEMLRETDVKRYPELKY
ncbi:Pyruvate/2-oxoglutarate/acetoin dehydrogenase complex, dehydrogenase (E1) component [Mariniphaga anaerophila]|uniref:3-methyl-2-oxobutanoate dehydrogenase (2-methylpropanoyl-transferring) n=1 Tax=Mariniphaga anaerophila TaxID=1484053 RepID=A0A1M4TRJ3_9BACT|nr:alpha-ketoacid dehydrogenase subunit alpha/beta [Mariniphaga anaerophila]SHE47129.1 Pyruvate/2-oxoglutarate/acetoin dehydrogenase complex, dehydrogenase (E1) component [Mariniphaga anaerophila]